MLVGLGRHRPDRLDHRILYRHQLSAGAARSPRRRETGHGTNVIQGLAISLESTALPTLVICVGIIVSYQLAGLIGIAFARDRDAGAGRHGRGARRLRPGHRQCRRHRRNGGPGGRRARPHRRARRGRQHHQGGDQGLCDRLGRRSPRWCCSAPTRPTSSSSSPASARGVDFSLSQPLRHRRPAARRAAALSVRRDGHDRGRPRGGRRGQGRARAVPRQSGHHGRHQRGPITPAPSISSPRPRSRR